LIDSGRTGRALLTPRQVRAALGALWLLDAALQAQPHLFTAEWWHSDLAQSVMGEPPAVAGSILWVINQIAFHPALWNGVFVAVQAVLGLCLLTGRFERAAVAASIPWALGIWWVGEGFAGLPAGFGLFAAGAPGPVLYYPMLGILAWPRRPQAALLAPTRTEGPSRRTETASVVWAALWAGGGMLLLVPWRFGAARVLRANLEERSLDQPQWLADTSHHAYQLVGSHPLLVPVALAAVEAAVGLGVFALRSRRVALTTGIALATVFWVVFENLGGIVGGDATDPGAAPLLIILGLSLWQRVSRHQETPVTHPEALRAGNRVTAAVLRAWRFKDSLFGALCDPVAAFEVQAVGTQGRQELDHHHAGPHPETALGGNTRPAPWPNGTTSAPVSMARANAQRRMKRQPNRPQRSHCRPE
jgi:hypothetical protein